MVDSFADSQCERCGNVYVGVGITILPVSVYYVVVVEACQVWGQGMNRNLVMDLLSVMSSVLTYMYTLAPLLLHPALLFG